MKYLLDTHTLIWSITNKQKLSKKALRILEDTQNDVYVSAINLWEISLKFSLGKLSLQGLSPEQIPELIKKMEFKIISLEATECATYHQLYTAYHKDPFDRMLIWQAICHEMILITDDENMSHYTSAGLRILW
jgi:PIN domain nuclease of toxin-antitoxin system